MKFLLPQPGVRLRILLESHESLPTQGENVTCHRVALRGIDIDHLKFEALEQLYGRNRKPFFVHEDDSLIQDAHQRHEVKAYARALTVWQVSTHDLDALRMQERMELFDTEIAGPKSPSNE
jgi:hypothetical protein